MNPRVVFALVLRHLFLYGRNWVRLVELFFWPTMELLVWGSLTLFLGSSGDARAPQFVAYLIGGVIFWDILFRSQQAVAISFLEDVWTKNLMNIFVAPVRPSEYVAAGLVVGILRTGITVTLLTILAAVNYHFDLFQLQFSLIPFFGNLLIFGWSLGMISSALILRWGQAAESLAWAVPFLIQPAACVFYPLSTLPEWAQGIGKALPCTHVFEGMRAALDGKAFDWGQMGVSLALNAVWLAFAAGLYAWVLESGRRRGMLTRVTSH
ncbi:MAG: ABC transporter permease [Verrucomicrobiales bacterium]|nr:ABC transporter permease [Verrucomicrobiales bacterium]